MVCRFPAKALQEVKWRVGHSYANDLEVEVLLLPKQGKAGQGLGSITYVIAMKTAGTGKRKHWVVNDLRPYGIAMPPFFAGRPRHRQARWWP